MAEQVDGKQVDLAGKSVVLVFVNSVVYKSRMEKKDPIGAAAVMRVTIGLFSCCFCSISISIFLNLN